MTVEELKLDRITLTGGIVVMEIYDTFEGVWEYWLNRGATMEFLFGTGERFTGEEIQRLFDTKYFEV